MAGVRRCLRAAQPRVRHGDLYPAQPAQRHPTLLQAPVGAGGTAADQVPRSPSHVRHHPAHLGCRSGQCSLPLEVTRVGTAFPSTPFFTVPATSGGQRESGFRSNQTVFSFRFHLPLARSTTLRASAQAVLAVRSLRGTVASQPRVPNSGAATALPRPLP